MPEQLSFEEAAIPRSHRETAPSAGERMNCIAAATGHNADTTAESL
jgi:hypothetical protein